MDMDIGGGSSDVWRGRHGACESKAWFSWPGSMIGSKLIEEKAKKQAQKKS